MKEVTNSTANIIANMLLKIGAVEINFENPFTWASGKQSPIYVDNRLALSYPEVRNFIKEQLVNQVKRHFPQVDSITAVATGGIPQGAVLADRLHLPLLYVRSSKKQHGKGSQVEGRKEEAGNTLILEDTISTGGSLIQAVEAVQEAGIEVGGALAIYSYHFETALNKLKDAGLECAVLCTLSNLIHSAEKRQQISVEEAEKLSVWAKEQGAILDV